MNYFSEIFEQEKEKMMAYMQAHLKVTNAEVLDHVGGPSRRREFYLRTLRKKGILKKVGYENGMPLYTVHDEASVQNVSARKRATPHGAIWMSFRVLKQFVAADVVASLAATESPATEAEVQKYCSVLCEAGYLKAMKKARPSKNRPARYMLVRDSGPLPPEIKQRQVVIDGNDERVVHVRGARL